jgi:hypothetical protein
MARGKDIWQPTEGNQADVCTYSTLFYPNGRTASTQLPVSEAAFDSPANLIVRWLRFEQTLDPNDYLWGARWLPPPAPWHK